MKSSKKCIKCHSLRVGYIETQPDVTAHVDLGDGIAQQRGEGVPGRGVGAGPVVDTGFLKFGKVSSVVGTLEAYVCTECGYYETYVRQPQAMEWGKIRDFHWVNENPEGGPYR